MKCPACGSAAERFLNADAAHISKYLAYSRLKYGGLLDDWLEEASLSISRCPDCGHHWYDSPPSEDHLTAMYAAGRPLRNGPPPREFTGPMLAEMRRLRKLVRDKRAPALLDYGSGFGRWARAASEAGFQVTAFEPSTQRGAESSVPFVVVHDVMHLRRAAFDVVNVEQVLEHVLDPFSTLQSIRRLCAPDAVVRISVPNLLRAPEGHRLWTDWPFDGQRPHTLAPFEHLHGFTPRSLARLVARAGFQQLAWWRLMASHPAVVMRRAAGQLAARAGQTLILAEPTQP